MADPLRHLLRRNVVLIVYNELVANAVVLQNIVNQTNALHLLRSEGALIRHVDLTFLS
jgi:hypothetical protein